MIKIYHHHHHHHHHRHHHHHQSPPSSSSLFNVLDPDITHKYETSGIHASRYISRWLFPSSIMDGQPYSNDTSVLRPIGSPVTHEQLSIHTNLTQFRRVAGMLLGWHCNPLTDYTEETMDVGHRSFLHIFRRPPEPVCLNINVRVEIFMSTGTSTFLPIYKRFSVDNCPVFSNFDMAVGLKGFK